VLFEPARNGNGDKSERCGLIVCLDFCAGSTSPWRTRAAQGKWLGCGVTVTVAKLCTVTTRAWPLGN
jgi:hypothetical protein